MKRIDLVAVPALALGLAASIATAAPSVIADIAGTWEGAGIVRRDADGQPMKVSCEVTGAQPSPNELGFAGECRAMLILRRDIGATFVLDGDHVTGTYTGANVGVAQLDGRAVSPTAWRLDMTFPREVNGDNKAVMMIEAPSAGTFRIVTSDRMLSGEEVTTTDVTFARK